MKLNSLLTEDQLMDYVMVNAYPAEPLAVSLDRLADAITKDGIVKPPQYSHLSVWTAYTWHPELAYPIDQPPPIMSNEEIAAEAARILAQRAVKIRKRSNPPPLPNQAINATQN